MGVRNEVIMHSCACTPYFGLLDHLSIWSSIGLYGFKVSLRLLRFNRVFMAYNRVLMIVSSAHKDSRSTRIPGFLKRDLRKLP